VIVLRGFASFRKRTAGDSKHTVQYAPSKMANRKTAHGKTQAREQQRAYCTARVARRGPGLRRFAFPRLLGGKQPFVPSREQIKTATRKRNQQGTQHVVL
jgi:hypothetical protein